ncbi:MAG: dihydropteroate synthase [Planctomycetota bacterium]|jgi:dihydropteroate synthase
MAGEFQFQTKSGPIGLGQKTQVAGILNLTPDSFSDGGRYVDAAEAIDRAQVMVAQGAAMIDIGACSTRPGAAAVGSEQELARLMPVVGKLAQRIDVPISIDTYHQSVFQACYDQGASILNDVTALSGDEGMAAFLGQTQAPCVLMHMQGQPETMQDRPEYADVVLDIKRFFSKVIGRAERFGVSCSQIILDPGIGFGKTLEQNLTILRRMNEFHELGRPLFVGTSRKSFLGKILDRADPLAREHATTATTVFLQDKGVQVVRVHDVEASVDALRILDQINNETNQQ